jgi:hypothetical protein
VFPVRYGLNFKYYLDEPQETSHDLLDFRISQSSDYEECHRLGCDGR